MDICFKMDFACKGLFLGALANFHPVKSKLDLQGFIHVLTELGMLLPLDICKFKDSLFIKLPCRSSKGGFARSCPQNTYWWSSPKNSALLKQDVQGSVPGTCVYSGESAKDRQSLLGKTFTGSL